jgi:hypothetical protein
LTATRPSGWEHSQVSASRSSRSIHSNTGRQSYAPMCGRCQSNAHLHSRDVLRDRFLASSSARCAGLSPMWRRHRAAAMTPRFRHTHGVVRSHGPSRQASLRKHRHGR